MKFSNGCWLQQEGCGCFAPQQAYYTKVETDKVTICAPTVRINHRGDTLGGINLTLVITAPMDEVIRVQVYHHLGAVNTYPAFDINADARPIQFRRIAGDGGLRLVNGQRSRFIGDIVIRCYIPAAAVLDLSGGEFDGAAGYIPGAGGEDNAT